MTEAAEPYIFLVSKFYSHLLIPGSDVRVRWVPEGRNYGASGSEDEDA